MNENNSTENEKNAKTIVFCGGSKGGVGTSLSAGSLTDCLLEANIESQIAALNPLLALIIDPADLPALISWVKNFITSFLTPYLVPLTTYEAQIAEIAIQVVAIAAAIEQIQNERPEIHITIPQFPNISCKL